MTKENTVKIPINASMPNTSRWFKYRESHNADCDQVKNDGVQFAKPFRPGDVGLFVH